MDMPSTTEKFERGYGLNDTGNGERFAAEHADTFRFLEDRQIWMGWDGKRWRVATEAEVTRAAKLTAKRMIVEAADLDDHERKQLLSHAQATLSRRGLSNMIACASSERVLCARMADFDTNLDLLTVENGTIYLPTGELRPHARENMLTQYTPIAYAPAAEAPRWRQFLGEVFNDDADLVEFMQRAVGYTLTGHTREHAFFLLWGQGRNGKGRFVAQLQALLGDAGKVCRFQTFTPTRTDVGNTPELAELAGARLVVAGEPDQGVKLSESVIKHITGEDSITVCRKYEAPFSYLPRFKLWLHTNYRPTIRGVDDGIWSRPRLIPFLTTFETEEEAAKKPRKKGGTRRDPDKKLDEKLAAERAGILRWAVEGAVKWYALGLGHCRTVDEATTGYREESDQLAPFIEECLEVRAGAFARSADIHTEYARWCRNAGIERPMEGQALAKQLVERGFRRGRMGNDRGFEDVLLLKGAATVATPAAAADGARPPAAVTRTLFQS